MNHTSHYKIRLICMHACLLLVTNVPFALYDLFFKIFVHFIQTELALTAFVTRKIYTVMICLRERHINSLWGGWACLKTFRRKYFIATKRCVTIIWIIFFHLTLIKTLIYKIKFHADHECQTKTLDWRILAFNKWFLNNLLTFIYSASSWTLLVKIMQNICLAQPGLRLECIRFVYVWKIHY